MPVRAARGAGAAALVWGGLALGLAAYAFAYPYVHTVYDIYAPAARAWWAGEDLYVLRSDHYRYSPLFAVGLTPFALLPDCLGGALWKALNALIYAAGLVTWARRVLPARLDRSQAGILSLLALPVSLHSLYIGQANCLMLGAVLFGLAAAASGKWNRSAAWLALATLIKGYPLALAMMLAVLYPRRFALRFAAALGIGLLLPFAFQWPGVVAGQYASWWHHLQDSTIIMRERLRSVDYLFEIAGHPLSPRTFGLMEVLAGAAVLGLCLLHAWQTADLREQLTRVSLLFAAWVVLFGPATETCTYIVIAPAVAWALLEAFLSPTAWATRLYLLACLLLMGPVVTDLFGQTVRNVANAHGSQPVGALLFLAYLLARTGRTYGALQVAGYRPAVAFDRF
jgi:hypothetical protein